MERLELLKRLAALTTGLVPARGVQPAQLGELRHLLAADLVAEARRPIRAGAGPKLQPERHDLELIDPGLRAELERALDSASETPDPSGPAPRGTRVARRSLPFASSAESLSAPSWAAGQQVARTLGPFVEPDGSLVWFDIVAVVQQASLVRAPATAPLLTLPLRGLVISPGTSYELPAGTVWIQSRALAPVAPVGAYSGIRIRRGRVEVSSPTVVSGLTLTVPNSARVTLDVELDPPVSTAPGPSPGRDAHEAAVAVPATATFVFTASGGTLAQAAEATLKVFGAGFRLRHDTAAAASFEPALTRLLLPFACNPATVTVGSSRSDLFAVSGEATVALAAWALPVAVAEPSQLGEAATAGALVLRTGSGLRATWRGVQTSPGRPIELGPSFVLAETDHVSIVAPTADGHAATQAVRLWDIPNPGQAELRLRIDRVRLHIESLAGRIDAVLVTGAVEAAVDRPVPVDGRRFALRSSSAVAVLFDDPAGSHALVQAALVPADATAVTALALRNALLTVSPPAQLFFTGDLDATGQARSGAFTLSFRLLHFLFTLPDPYASNQPTPGRGGLAPATGAAAPASTMVISRVAWTTPSSPALTFALQFPGSQASSPAMANAVAPPAVVAEQPVSFLTRAAAAGVAGEEYHPVNPEQARQEDREALQRLRAIFESAAGPTRESLVLLDVSTNVDQYGVAWGLTLRDGRVMTSVPLQIDGMDVVSPGQNTRLFLLPQFQWEPVRNLPNPNIEFFYPDRLVSGDDGSATLFGSNSVRLVPVRPDRVRDSLVKEFNDPALRQMVGARFTLPYGIEAAARLTPATDGGLTAWTGLDVVRPQTTNGRFSGGYQLAVTAHNSIVAPTQESPSLPGAAWQTRNGVDPATGALNGFSVLRGDILNDGVEAFFNGEMGPAGKKPRVPVVRVDFAGYGASAFSKWVNPNAIASVNEVRFDVFVGRTAYEVVQVASILYPFAAPVVRTITLERRKDAMVVRFDSGWVATAPGLFRYPPNDPGFPLPPGWVAIETHPGVVGGAFNIRRIRETGRVVKRTFGTEEVELLEVRFDADMAVEGVVTGQITGTNRVPSIDQVGYVQRLPKGHPLIPQHLADIMADEGPMGGPVNCEIVIAGSGQMMHVVRVDVAAAPQLAGGTPEFAAAARGTLALPEDGATWSIARRFTSADEFEPVDPIAGTPLVRQGRASGAGVISPFYRIADPGDLLREAAPASEFGLLQTSDGHQFLLPRPRLQQGSATITTTERSLLADAYARSTSAGLFPKRSSCFVGQVVNELQIAGNRFRLGPVTTAAFDPIAGGVRNIVGGDAFGIRSQYGGPIRYALDPALPTAWDVAVDAVTTSLDLGPFKDLMGVRHNFLVDGAQSGKLLNPELIYAPFLAPVVDIVQFLSKLLGIGNLFEIAAVQGSYRFQATAQYPIEGPGNDYVDFGAMKIKGKLQTGFGWSEKDHWFGFFKVELGMKVVVLPPIFANGKAALSLKGSELTKRELTIRVLWGASVEAKLGPIGVSAEFNYGIEVITAEGGAWQIGLIVQVIGKADIFIVKVAIKLELMAAIARLPAGTVEAIGQAKFAGEVEICWFLTISFEYEIEYREELSI